jgi:hypothetical protein
MSFEEMVVALVASIGGIIMVGFIFAKITGLIKAWINRNNNSIPEEQFNRLAKAFMEHKKETQRRLKNLEAIAAGDDISENASNNEKTKQIDAPKDSIEIDDRDEEKEQSQSDTDSNLRNMLKE